MLELCEKEFDKNLERLIYKETNKKYTIYSEYTSPNGYDVEKQVLAGEKNESLFVRGTGIWYKESFGKYDLYNCDNELIQREYDYVHTMKAKVCMKVLFCSESIDEIAEIENAIKNIFNDGLKIRLVNKLDPDTFFYSTFKIDFDSDYNERGKANKENNNEIIYYARYMISSDDFIMIDEEYNPVIVSFDDFLQRCLLEKVYILCKMLYTNSDCEVDIKDAIYTVSKQLELDFSVIGEEGIVTLYWLINEKKMEMKEAISKLKDTKECSLLKEYNKNRRLFYDEKYKEQKKELKNEWKKKTLQLKFLYELKKYKYKIDNGNCSRLKNDAAYHVKFRCLATDKYVDSVVSSLQGAWNCNVYGGSKNFEDSSVTKEMLPIIQVDSTMGPELGAYTFNIGTPQGNYMKYYSLCYNPVIIPMNIQFRFRINTLTQEEGINLLNYLKTYYMNGVQYFAVYEGSDFTPFCIKVLFDKQNTCNEIVLNGIKCYEISIVSEIFTAPILLDDLTDEFLCNNVWQQVSVLNFTQYTYSYIDMLKNSKKILEAKYNSLFYEQKVFTFDSNYNELKRNIMQKQYLNRKAFDVYFNDVLIYYPYLYERINQGWGVQMMCDEIDNMCSVIEKDIRNNCYDLLSLPHSDDMVYRTQKGNLELMDKLMANNIPVIQLIEKIEKINDYDKFIEEISEEEEADCKILNKWHGDSLKELKKQFKGKASEDVLEPAKKVLEKAIQEMKSNEKVHEKESSNYYDYYDENIYYQRNKYKEPKKYEKPPKPSKPQKPDLIGSYGCIIGKKKGSFTQSCNFSCPLWHDCARGSGYRI